jgi:hypothetical protein
MLLVGVLKQCRSQAANSRFVILSYSNELEYESSLSMCSVKSPPFFFADRGPSSSHISAFLAAINDNVHGTAPLVEPC